MLVKNIKMYEALIIAKEPKIQSLLYLRYWLIYCSKYCSNFKLYPALQENLLNIILGRVVSSNDWNENLFANMQSKYSFIHNARLTLASASRAHVWRSNEEKEKYPHYEHYNCYADMNDIESSAQETKGKLPRRTLTMKSVVKKWENVDHLVKCSEKESVEVSQTTCDHRQVNVGKFASHVTLLISSGIRILTDGNSSVAKLFGNLNAIGCGCLNSHQTLIDTHLLPINPYYFIASRFYATVKNSRPMYTVIPIEETQTSFNRQPTDSNLEFNEPIDSVVKKEMYKRNNPMESDNMSVDVMKCFKTHGDETHFKRHTSKPVLEKNVSTQEVVDDSKSSDEDVVPLIKSIAFSKQILYELKQIPVMAKCMLKRNMKTDQLLETSHCIENTVTANLEPTSISNKPIVNVRAKETEKLKSTNNRNYKDSQNKASVDNLTTKNETQHMKSTNNRIYIDTKRKISADNLRTKNEVEQIKSANNRKYENVQRKLSPVNLSTKKVVPMKYANRKYENTQRNQSADNLNTQKCEIVNVDRRIVKSPNQSRITAEKSKDENNIGDNTSFTINVNQQNKIEQLSNSKSIDNDNGTINRNRQPFTNRLQTQNRQNMSLSISMNAKSDKQLELNRSNTLNITSEITPTTTPANNSKPVVGEKTSKFYSTEQLYSHFIKNVSGSQEASNETVDYTQSLTPKTAESKKSDEKNKSNSSNSWKSPVNEFKISFGDTVNSSFNNNNTPNQGAQFVDYFKGRFEKIK